VVRVGAEDDGFGELVVAAQGDDRAGTAEFRELQGENGHAAEGRLAAGTGSVS